MPILALEGQKSKITDLKEVADFLQKSNSDRIKLNVFKTGFHNLLSGEGRQAVFDVIIKWLKQVRENAIPLDNVEMKVRVKYRRTRTIKIIAIVSLLLVYFKGLKM